MCSATSRSSPDYLLLKLPAILGDLALAWICGRVRRAARARGDAATRARCAPWSIAAVLFNPAVFALSAVWGQVDAVPAVFVRRVAAACC